MKDTVIKHLMIDLLRGHYIATKSKSFSINFSTVSDCLGFSECHKEFVTTYLLANHGPKLVTKPILLLINGYSVHSFFDIEYNLRQQFLLKCMNLGVSTVKKGYRYKSNPQVARGLCMLENIAQNFHEYLSPTDW
jgi:hypothetical protein